MSVFDPDTRAGYVAHLAERLRDDGLLHQSPPWIRRGRCYICDHVLTLAIKEQVALAVEARRAVAREDARIHTATCEEKSPSTDGSA